MRKIINTAFGLLHIQLSSSAMEGASAAEINLYQAMGTLKAGNLVADKRLTSERLEPFKEILAPTVKKDNSGEKGSILSVITLRSLKTYLSNLYDEQHFKTLSFTTKVSYLHERQSKAYTLGKYLQDLLLKYSDPIAQAHLYFITALCQRKIFELHQHFSQVTRWGVGLQQQRFAKVNRTSAKTLAKVVKSIDKLERPTLSDLTLKAVALKNLESLTKRKIEKIDYLHRLRAIVMDLLADDDFDTFFSQVPNFELIEGAFETVGNSITRLGFYDQVADETGTVNINLLYQDYPNLIVESIEERIKQLEELA